MLVRLARLAQESGISGVVASADDIDAIREACGPDFIVVTPGIRDAAETGDDQKRTSTARSAIARGADYIVVGRPIRNAENPVEKVIQIVKEITEGLAIRKKVV